MLDRILMIYSGWNDNECIWVCMLSSQPQNIVEVTAQQPNGLMFWGLRPQACKETKNEAASMILRIRKCASGKFSLHYSSIPTHLITVLEGPRTCQSTCAHSSHTFTYTHTNTVHFLYLRKFYLDFYTVAEKQSNGNEISTDIMIVSASLTFVLSPTDLQIVSVVYSFCSKTALLVVCLIL